MEGTHVMTTIIAGVAIPDTAAAAAADFARRPSAWAA
jgi:hypothetical protein